MCVPTYFPEEQQCLGPDSHSELSQLKITLIGKKVPFCYKNPTSPVSNTHTATRDGALARSSVTAWKHCERLESEHGEELSSHPQKRWIHARERCLASSVNGGGSLGVSVGRQRALGGAGAPGHGGRRAP